MIEVKSYRELFNIIRVGMIVHPTYDLDNHGNVKDTLYNKMVSGGPNYAAKILTTKIIDEMSKKK